MFSGQWYRWWLFTIKTEHGNGPKRKKQKQKKRNKKLNMVESCSSDQLCSILRMSVFVCISTIKVVRDVFTSMQWSHQHHYQIFINASFYRMVSYGKRPTVSGFYNFLTIVMWRRKTILPLLILVSFWKCGPVYRGTLWSLCV